MARTKYTFEKRQLELARKQKKEEKAARRSEAKKQDDPSLGEDSEHTEQDTTPLQES
jgi:hypothetical protein